MNYTKFAKAALLSGFLVLVSACSAVAPWERGTLAKPHMALDPNPIQSALQGHTYGSREAGSGSSSASGGGCGCY